ncbi:hypothetical protein LTR53_006959 [Teratosphaeriaceae sp. CCFEE 6253]|nr:hypothetical protein LTR53_006959 [Teratosphaeriaceae sp. CCFEE 6253]
MASQATTAGRATVGAGYLHTPEEKPFDSFTQGSSKDEFGTKLAPVTTLSPPISPEDIALPTFASTSSQETRDELLYPDHTQSEDQAPLFHQQREHSDAQGNSVPASPFKRLRVTTTPDLVTVPGTLIQIERSPEGAKAYYDSCMASLEGIRFAQRAAGTLPFPQRSSNAQARDAVSARQLHSLLTRPASVTKSTRPASAKSPLKHTAKPITPKASPPKAAPIKAATPDATAVPSKRSRTPRQRSHSDFLSDAFPGDNDKKHKRAAPSKQTPSKESDLHWREMEDFSPPLSSLDSLPNRLKAVWGPGTAPLDIHDEQDAECLTEIEIEVAATLRLKPVQYLANKRRIFEAKVQSLRENKGFTKTAAQSACNIDVNKASALWIAFDKVGWFERRWFEKWL